MILSLLVLSTDLHFAMTFYVSFSLLWAAVTHQVCKFTLVSEGTHIHPHSFLLNTLPVEYVSSRPKAQACLSWLHLPSGLFSPLQASQHNTATSMASSRPLPVPSHCPCYLPLPVVSVHTTSDSVHCSLPFPVTESFLISQRWHCFVPVPSPHPIPHNAARGIFRKLVPASLQFKDPARCSYQPSVKSKVTFPNS